MVTGLTDTLRSLLDDIPFDEIELPVSADWVREQVGQAADSECIAEAVPHADFDSLADWFNGVVAEQLADIRARYELI